MRIPGFDRRGGPTTLDDPVYVERRRGESAEAFEARLAEMARGRPGRAWSDVDSERPAMETVGGPMGADETAYAAGRRDQRRLDRAERPAFRRAGLGLFGVAVALVALFGVLWIVLAVREGSFSAGGAVVDRKIAAASQPVRMATNQAVDRTGQAVQDAGQAIEGQGERIRGAAD